GVQDFQQHLAKPHAAAGHSAAGAIPLVLVYEAVVVFVVAIKQLRGKASPFAAADFLVFVLVEIGELRHLKPSLTAAASKAARPSLLTARRRGRLLSARDHARGE